MIELCDFWRDIPGTDGKYQISRLGDIRHVWPSGHISSVKPYTRNRNNHGIRQQIHLRINGKDRTMMVFSMLTAAWVGPPPPGKIWYHRNGNPLDNRVDNIGAIDPGELGRITGGRSMRRAVEMIDRDGNVVELYVSAREAARENSMSLGCVTDRCEGKIKQPFELNGYSFRWEENNGRSKKKRRTS